MNGKNSPIANAIPTSMSIKISNKHGHTTFINAISQGLLELKAGKEHSLDVVKEKLGLKKVTIKKQLR